MTWTTPKTWSANEIVGAADMNTHVRDNMNALKDPPFYHSAITAAWTGTAAGTWTGVSSLSAVVGTNGGDVMVGFRALAVQGRAFANLLIDGSAYTSAERGLAQAWHANMPTTGAIVEYTVWVTGLPSGTHTFQPLFSGVGILDGEKSPTIFWAREVS